MNKPAETLSLLPLWFGGGKVASQSARFGEVTNPATGEVIRRVPFANGADIDAAVAAAKQAFPAERDVTSEPKHPGRRISK